MDLTPAIAAAQRGRWSEVIDCLQILPIESSAQDVQADVWKQILDLAIQVLIDGDFEEQWAIAKIIPKLGEIAIQPLLNIVNDPEVDLEDRWFAARILGGFQQPQVVTSLVHVIQQGEDSELVAMATSALAQIGTPAIAALGDLLDTPDRYLAVKALAQIRHSQTIEPLLSVSDDDDPQLRTLVVEALGSFHDPRIPPILLTKLTDLAASVRQAAVAALSLRQDLATELDLVQHLRPLLFDLNLAVCSAAALGLARFPDPTVVDILTQVLVAQQTPAALKSSLILALGWIGSPAAIDSLAAILPQAPIETARVVISSISKTEHDRIYASQALIAYFRQGEPEPYPAEIRQEIAAALGNLGNIDAVSDLVQLLADPDERVRLYAVAAISKLSVSIPPEIRHLAAQPDISPDLASGLQMYRSHWEQQRSAHQ